MLFEKLQRQRAKAWSLITTKCNGVLFHFPLNWFFTRIFPIFCVLLYLYSFVFVLMHFYRDFYEVWLQQNATGCFSIELLFSKESFHWRLYLKKQVLHLCLYWCTFIEISLSILGLKFSFNGRDLKTWNICNRFLKHRPTGK